MFRIQPTGNTVFDAAEVAAQSIYQAALENAVTDSAVIQAEVGYLFSCWTAAIVNFPAQPGFADVITAGNHTGLVALPSSNTVDTSGVAGYLASALRSRGFTQLPNVLWKAAVATIVSGGTGTYVVGDVMTTAAGGTIVGSLFPGAAAATWTVLTLSTGAIATMKIKQPGLYSVVPTGNVALTGGSGGGSPTATIVFYPLYT